MILRNLTAIALLLITPSVTVVAASEAPITVADKKAVPAKKQPTPPAKPLVKKISTDVYQIGKITFNKKTREISLIARTNLVEPGTPFEFVLVHLNGEKVHESLLITEADPTNLNIALKLLSYKESQELFRPITEDGSRSEEYQIENDATRSAARFTIHVTWKDGDQQKSAPITHWLKHRITNKKMPNIPWVYNGSYIHNNKFIAKLNGNFFAILPNESALATFFGAPGVDRYDDTLWVSTPNLPNEATEITVTLKPWSGKLKPQILK